MHIRVAEQVNQEYGSIRQTLYDKLSLQKTVELILEFIFIKNEKKSSQSQCSTKTTRIILEWQVAFKYKKNSEKFFGTFKTYGKAEDNEKIT